VAGGLRRRAEAPLRRWWAGEAGAWGAVLAAATAPAAALYGWGVRLRNLAYDTGLLRSAKPPIPVISVGNLTVGGTGKTPLTAWIVDLVLEEGRRPAVVSSGYGEDELLLHARWHPGVPVIAASRRTEGVRRAAEAGADVAILDDAFQHRALRRDLDLVSLSPADPFPPRLLPRGPYREPLRALRRADLLLVTAKGDGEERAARALLAELGRASRLPSGQLFPLRAGAWTDLAGARVPAPEGPVLAVTSVAQPRGFVTLLAEQGIPEVDLLAFPDHHPYEDADVGEIRTRAGERTVVTTEKDAVKLEAWATALPGTRVLPLRPAPSRGTVEAVRLRLRELPAGPGPSGSGSS
jgi:tetraacyldisaccharide 4'-kinase